MIPWNHWPQYEGPLRLRPNGEYFTRGYAWAECQTCERPYREHPRDFWQLDEGFAEPFLRVLCSGARVKL